MNGMATIQQLTRAGALFVCFLKVLKGSVDTGKKDPVCEDEWKGSRVSTEAEPEEKPSREAESSSQEQSLPTMTLMRRLGTDGKDLVKSHGEGVMQNRCSLIHCLCWWRLLLLRHTWHNVPDPVFYFAN